MPTEVTANVMIGPIRADSTHGRPSLRSAARLFAPSHVMVLMEGHRATWMVQRCPNLSGPATTLRIRPGSPDHLLAAAVLGYVALTMPRVIRESGELRSVVGLAKRHGDVRILPIDHDLACRVFTYCSEHIYGVVTTLLVSSIKEGELRIAADSGMQIATVAPAVAGPAAIA
jgi:hypothetical protein